MADHPGYYILELQRRLAELQAQQHELRERHDEVGRQIEAEYESEDNFRLLQKKQAFEFAKFRTEGRRLTSGEILLRKFRRLKLPKRGRYRGPGLLAGKWKGSRFSWDPDYIGHHGNSETAKKTRIRLQRRLKAHNFNLERTLGWGGHGIASLYRFRRGLNRPVEYVVVKSNIDNNDSAEKSLILKNSLIRERKAQEVGE